MILGLLAEKQFGRIRLFVNGENLTGVQADAMGSAASPDARCGRSLDRRCVGAARRPEHQRWPARPILDAGSLEAQCSPTNQNLARVV